MGVLYSKNCSIHSNEKCIFFCLECKTLMCALCRENKAHQSHKTEVRLVENLCSEIIDKLNKIKLSLDPSNAPTYEKNIDEILTEGYINIDEVFDKIKDKVEEFRKEVKMRFKEYMHIRLQKVITPLYDKEATIKQISNLRNEIEKLIIELKIKNQQESYNEILDVISKVDSYKKISSDLLSVQSKFKSSTSQMPYEIHTDFNKLIGSLSLIINKHFKMMYSLNNSNDMIPSLKTNRLHYIDTSNYDLKQYHISTQEWNSQPIKIPSLLPDIGFQTLETSTNQLYIIGGKKGNQLVSAIIELTEGANEIIPLHVGNMGMARMYHAVCSGDAHDIYICGGENDVGTIDYCEKFVFSSKQIEKLPPLKEKKQFHSIIHHEKYIIAVGGCINEMYCETIEMLPLLNPNEWCSIKMVEAKSNQEIGLQNPCLLKYGKEGILIVGGFNQCDKTECYLFTPGIDKLSTFNLSLKIPKNFARYSVCEHKGKLYINSKSDILIFDTNRQKWINREDIAA